MTNKQFNKFVKEFRRNQDELITLKGFDYTQGDSDRLHNFKFVAEHTGLTPVQVWSVYWLKHVLAILTFVKHGEVRSESIEGRFLDEANYNLLGLAILKEQQLDVHSRRRKANKRKTRK